MDRLFRGLFTAQVGPAGYSGHTNRTSGCLHKFDHLQRLGGVDRLPRLFDGIHPFQPGAEKDMIGALDFQTDFGADARAAQSHDIQPGQQILVIGDGIGRDIRADGRHALEHGQIANADELMDSRIAGKHGTVADMDMAADQGGIGQNDIIAQNRVVRDMDIGHQQTVIADNGILIQIVGAVERDHLAEGVPAADAQTSGAARVFQVLRLRADHGTDAEIVFLARGSMSRDAAVVIHFASGSQLHKFINNGKRAHFNRGMDLGVRMNDRCRMNHISYLSG